MGRDDFGGRLLPLPLVDVAATEPLTLLFARMAAAAGNAGCSSPCVDTPRPSIAKRRPISISPQSLSVSFDPLESCLMNLSIKIVRGTADLDRRNRLPRTWMETAATVYLYQHRISEFFLSTPSKAARIADGTSELFLKWSHSTNYQEWDSRLGSTDSCLIDMEAHVLVSLF